MFIGNTFPLTLVRRPCTIQPITDIQAKKLISKYDYICSFWGHTNTLKIASQYAGFDLTPETERPALELNDDNYPLYNGYFHDVVLVLSPEYKKGFRPAIGVEVTLEEVLGWSWLLVEFIA